MKRGLGADVDPHVLSDPLLLVHDPAANGTLGPGDGSSLIS